MQKPRWHMPRSAQCTLRISRLGRQCFPSLPGKLCTNTASSSQVLGNTEVTAGGCKRLDSIASVACFCSARSHPERGFRSFSRVLSLQEIQPLCPCCLSFTFQFIIQVSHRKTLKNHPSFKAHLVEICCHLLTSWEEQYFTTAVFKN